MLKNGEDPLLATAKRFYIDWAGRVYDDWKKWKEENKLPMLKYAIPVNGFYTTGKGLVYEFNPAGELDLCFENSPSCNFSAKLFQALDSFSTVGGIGKCLKKQ